LDIGEADMIQSMTGFGTAEKDGFKAEVRSLNHRYIDISIKIPSFLAEHEMPLRNLIKERFSRGKFDIIISLTDKQREKVGVNKELAKEIYDTFSELQKELSIPGSLNIDFFSGYRELLISEKSLFNTEMLYDAINDALSQVETMRNAEGEGICKEMLKCIKKLEDIQGEINRRAKEIASTYKENLTKKIADLLLGAPIDEARIAQEAAILAQKSDVTEEISRLLSHIRQFRAYLSSHEAVGRRLDFLLQEMNREANTIASKVGDIDIINLTIEIKVEIEKLREQVQNIQ
jgi:uncharacterized protein (TIGR00255 family)